MRFSLSLINSSLFFYRQINAYERTIDNLDPLVHAWRNVMEIHSNHMLWERVQLYAPRIVLHSFLLLNPCSNRYRMFNFGWNIDSKYFFPIISNNRLQIVGYQTKSNKINWLPIKEEWKYSRLLIHTFIIFVEFFSLWLDNNFCNNLSDFFRRISDPT